MDALNLSGATINRHLELWRAVHRKARDEWELPVRPISWKLHRRKQAKERVRSITHGEARRVIGALPEHIALIVMFSFATGCRRRKRSHSARTGSTRRPVKPRSTPRAAEP